MVISGLELALKKSSLVVKMEGANRSFKQSNKSFLRDSSSWNNFKVSVTVSKEETKINELVTSFLESFRLALKISVKIWVEILIRSCFWDYRVSWEAFLRYNEYSLHKTTPPNLLDLAVLMFLENFYRSSILKFSEMFLKI